MRVAVVSSASGGGAGIAALRIARSLQEHAGLAVEFIDIASVGAVASDESSQRNSNNGRISNTQFTVDRVTARREWLVQFLAGFHVVNLHWTAYVLATSEIEMLVRTGTPVLMTLHDFNHVTGGCHYPAGCTGMYSGCMGCPQIERGCGNVAEDVYRLKRRKNAIFRHPNVHIAAPSRYVLDAARRAVDIEPSRTHLLRNPYDPLVLHAVAAPDGSAPRPLTVLLVADWLGERRKGAMLAAEVLQVYCAPKSGNGALRIHIAGGSDAGLIRMLRDTGAEVIAHGRIADHAELAAIYAQCDVQLSTSHEDNWPNVLVEAAAYGCLAIVGPGHGCEEFARRYPGCHVTDDYTPAAFVQALQQLATMPATELRACKSAMAVAVRADHAPDAVAVTYAAALRSVCAMPTEPSERSLSGGSSRDAAISSNYLGCASRAALAAAEPSSQYGQMEVCLERSATSSGAMTLCAVYRSQHTEALVEHALQAGIATIPLKVAGTRLRHVFASEASDYGLSTLTCRLSPDDAEREAQ
jgi:glycosyltransferase involved in cell wall biosynthesis